MRTAAIALHAFPFVLACGLACDDTADPTGETEDGLPDRVTHTRRITPLVDSQCVPCDATFAWAPVAQVRLVRKPAFRAQSVPTVRGCGEAAPATGRAVKAFTWGRTFSIVASATPYITADGPATGSCRDWDTPILGCAVTRDIEL